MPDKPGKTFDEFMVEIRKDLDRYEAWYKRHAEKFPDHFPLTVPLDNEGAQFDDLMTFLADPDNCEDLTEADLR